MRIFFAILLLSALATAQVGSTPPEQSAPSAPAVPANSGYAGSTLKARVLLDQAIAALGGQAYLTSQSLVEEGRLYTIYHGQTRGAGVQYRQISRFPGQDRVEIAGRGSMLIPIPWFDSVSVIVVSKKSSKDDTIIVHNGDKGYETTNKGTSAMDKDDLKDFLRRRQHSLDEVLRTWIKDPNMQYFYEGMAIIDGKPADPITLLNQKNDSVTVYLDQNSHLPLKTSFTWRDPEDKQKNVEEVIFDNYRLVQGIMTPYSITRTFNGETTHQRFINQAKYNLPLDDSLFAATVDYNPMAPPKKK